MRYINAASVLHAIGADPSCGKCKQSRSDCLCQSLSRMDVCGIMEDAPYVDIVYCKDCILYDTHDKRCKHWNHGVSMDDYCSYGEKE